MRESFRTPVRAITLHLFLHDHQAIKSCFDFVYREATYWRTEYLMETIDRH